MDNSHGCDDCVSLTKDKKCSYNYKMGYGRKHDECLPDGDCDKYWEGTLKIDKENNGKDRTNTN